MNFGKGDGENQDTYVTAATSSKCFVGVFDGHGEMGKRISHFARSALTKHLFNHKELHSDPAMALESAYRSTQHQIESQHGQEAAQSGTTAVAAYQHRDRLFVANVGDSRAVLGRCDTSRGRTIAAVDLSSDHKPSRPDEKKRVLAAGGNVDQMAFPVMVKGGLRWMRGGPERVMDKNGMGGLAMSRSLGDLSLRPYVSAQPELIERRLDSRDKVLVLGSDGIWDHISSQEAVDIACRHGDPAVAARELANVARRRWQTETDGQMSDDITAVVVKLDSSSPAGTPTRHVGGIAPPIQQRSVLPPASGSAPDRTLTATARRTGSQYGRGRPWPDGARSGSTGPLKLGSQSIQTGSTLRVPELMPPAGRRSHGVPR